MQNNKHGLVDDIYGKALIHYYYDLGSERLIVHSDIAETEAYPLSWFFRSPNQFPELEKIALSMCHNKILDVGAGTGVHTLALQEIGANVHAIDTSKGAVNIMKERGVNNVSLIDFFEVKHQKYDTILMLMNGFGMMGKVARIPYFFAHIEKLLRPNGQLIADSSDLLHLYTEKDGSVLLDLNRPYYGEIVYQMEFNKQFGYPFDWLFIDFNLLKYYAEAAGFKAKKIFEEENSHYLAKISRK